MQLYSYFRSSAAYRVRIALNLKHLPYEIIPVHLLKNGGEHHAVKFHELNPQELIPVLKDGSAVITQSLAILEYLNEVAPQPHLLPADPVERARVRSLALQVACDIHPLNNLRVLKYLKHELKVEDAQKDAWIRHWIEDGLLALEQRLVSDPATGLFCHGDTPGMADCCLVPQVFNAQRFGCDTSAMPTVMRIYHECMGWPEFEQAAPERQRDAE